MGCTVIVGGAFGDEGKGKIVSHIALKYNPKIAVRGGVGPNAGHTVVYSGRTLRLRMIPSAVVNEMTELMIGAGVLVDPKVFFKEITDTGSQKRIKIDINCALIEQLHIDRDREGHLKEKIGTTGTGTGPANAEHVLRTAKTAGQDPDLRQYVGDIALAVNEAIDRGQRVLVEGTQGTMLSLYHGTYPYVTSKDVSASAICSDVGIGPKKVEEVIVVFKAYVTRVGEGPLEGELSKEEATRRGWQEYGSVTGRPRRAAPFDFKLARRSVMLNSASQIALTKLDAVFPETSHAKNYRELSNNAREFVQRIERHAGVQVSLIGTGPDTEDIIDRSRS
jgi:adenylosuccinate synthase